MGGGNNPPGSASLEKKKTEVDILRKNSLELGFFFRAKFRPPGYKKSYLTITIVNQVTHETGEVLNVGVSQMTKVTHQSKSRRTTCV